MEIQVLKLRNAMGLLEGIAKAKIRQTKTVTTGKTRRGRAVAVKDTVPSMLSNILLQDGRAIATDLDTAVCVDLPEVTGQYLVPSQAVSKMLRYVPGNEELTIDMRGGSLFLAWSGGQAHFNTEKPEDYPMIPKVVPMMRWSIPSDLLVPAMLSLVDYCATEAERPVLNGISLFLGDPLEIAAGDGYRMAYKTIPTAMPPGGGINTIIIPSRAVLQLGHIWEKGPRPTPDDGDIGAFLASKGHVELEASTTMLKAQFGIVSLITRTIDGTPPNFKQLLPTELPNNVQIYAPDFERALKRVEGTAKEGKGIVRLSWTDGHMAVSAEDSGSATVESSIPVQALNGDGKIAMHIRYLLEYIKGRSGVVLMGTKDVSSPAVFRQGNSPVVVMMPMFVQWPGDAMPQPAAENTAQQPDPAQEEETDSPDEIDETSQQELDSAAGHEATAA